MRIDNFLFIFYNLKEMQFNGQIAQDYFVRKVLKEKRNGTFVEIGSNDPIGINNTYLLEKSLQWSGLMIEYDPFFENGYKQHRSNSQYIIGDATKINFDKELDNRNFPLNIDYLQIDLEVENRSTLTTLEHFDQYVFPKRKFAVVTFEHDIYRGNYFDTQRISREIFEKHGYYCVYPNIGFDGPGFAGIPAHHFEDWYVHPDLVDMDYIKQIERKNEYNYAKLMPLW
jgi:hypothetical protein